MEHVANIAGGKELLTYKRLKQLRQNRDAHDPKLGRGAVLKHGLSPSLLRLLEHAARNQNVPRIAKGRPPKINRFSAAGLAELRMMNAQPRGGGGFLAGAAQTALGVTGGVLLGNAIAGMLGGSEAKAAEPATDKGTEEPQEEPQTEEADFNDGGADFGDFDVDI